LSEKSDPQLPVLLAIVAGYVLGFAAHWLWYAGKEWLRVFVAPGIIASLLLLDAHGGAPGISDAIEIFTNGTVYSLILSGILIFSRRKRPAGT